MFLKPNEDSSAAGAGRSIDHTLFATHPPLLIATNRTNVPRHF
jgi:hypothetical protein